MEDITEFVKENKDNFELIAIKRNVDNELQERALKVVREFIMEKKLILYGGIAIDYALRLKGSKIYTEDTLPDFDMFSSDSINDSYDLVELLLTSGFKNVDTVRALHAQTQRVRVDSIVVADISYCPQKVYDKLDTLVYSNLRVLHPNYQRLDMYESLSFPLDGLPNTAFNHRWKKDIARCNLFEEKYPIESDETNIPGTKKEFKIPQDILKQTALCGVAAFAILRDLMEKIDKDSAKDIPKITIQLSETRHSSSIESKDSTSISIDPCPEDELVIISPDPEHILSILKTDKIQRYNSYMDWIPTHIITQNIKILSSENRMLSISSPASLNVQSKDFTPTSFGAQSKDFALAPLNLQICSPQYLMAYFLCMFNITGKEWHKTLYVNTMNIVKWADKHFKDAKKEDIIYNPFLLPLKFLGNKTEKEQQYLMKLGLREKLKIVSESELEFLKTLPLRAWYPEKNPERPKSYNYDNVLFKIDGSSIS